MHLRLEFELKRKIVAPIILHPSINNSSLIPLNSNTRLPSSLHKNTRSYVNLRANPACTRPARLRPSLLAGLAKRNPPSEQTRTYCSLRSYVARSSTTGHPLLLFLHLKSAERKKERKEGRTNQQFAAASGTVPSICPPPGCGCHLRRESFQ